ncbi:prolipoprotein diacylglyceryl transferase, partial [Candidatus Woesearchaeota archaeon]|nr:prolipoprotein diacylglyceryl transferase [Candidatus Woesearchaeota archaeon]
MFVHNINPTLLNIGPFEIRYYGLVYVIGFLLIWYVLNKKKQELKLTKKDVESFILYIILG